MDRNLFQSRYTSLTESQKVAVDTVEGPVMVVAGPGTGKTHVLTLRIANILLKTQAKPSEILALTFTDSAVSTMRARLRELVGSRTSGEISIYTFHGFCEEVIRRYPEYFEAFSMRRAMSDVEESLLLFDLFDACEQDTLSPPKAPYSYLHDFRMAKDTLLREGMSSAEYRAWGEKQCREVERNVMFQYKRGEKKGELTKAGLAERRKYERVVETANLIDAYQELKEERGVYDFGDMLHTAIEGIRSHEGLRADLQEHYQYVLADEHQDANALQHELLELLAYDEHPNLFVVGDTKQAIYRFQGGDLSGFATFNTLFPRTRVATLTESFRSLSGILDSAYEVIEDERLIAVRTGVARQHLLVGSDPLDEREKVALSIKQALKEGIAPHEIAVIARKNETVDLFALHLEAHGIPALRAGDVTLSSRPLIQAFLALLRVVADPLDTVSLRTALLAPWWNLDSVLVTRVLRTTRDTELMGEIKKSCSNVSDVLEEAIEKRMTTPPVELVSLLLERSGARDFMLIRGECLDDIPLLRALMLYIEDVSRIQSGTTFVDVIATLTRAERSGLRAIKHSQTQKEGFVSVITAHKAKGMEFERVFVVDATERSMERGGVPSKIRSPFETRASIEDAQRLFFVALTRAKDQLFISYSTHDANGKEQKPSSLIPPSLTEMPVATSPIPLVHQNIQTSDLVVSLSRQYLTESGLSPSAFNEYLTSPPTFFARRVLRMYEAPEGPAILGTAVHRAIARLLEDGNESQAASVLERVFQESLLPRNKTYDKLRNTAHSAFLGFSKEVSTLGDVESVEKTFESVHTISGEKIKLTGKVDALCKRDGKTVLVDFKTGGSISSKDVRARRQLMLYTLMLRDNEVSVDEHILLKVHPDEVKEYSVSFTEDDEKELYEELETVVQELLSGTWRRGEPSPYDGILTLLS